MGRENRPQRLIGVGAGGHAKNVIDAVLATDRWRVSALLDQDPATWGTSVLGVRVLGNADLLADLHDRGITNAFVGVGGIPDTSARQAVFGTLTEAGFRLPPIVHPRAVFSRWSLAAAGCQVLAGAIVNADSRLGQGVVVGTGAIVGHDAIVDDHSHVAAGARISGGARVGRGALIGAGAIVLQGISVGDGAVVGAGAVVTADVADGAVAIGIPASPTDHLGVAA